MRVKASMECQSFNGKSELEIYNTKNPVIKFLSNRLISQVTNILKDFDAYAYRGLDIGCGEGQLITKLYNRGVVKDIIAIDIDENRLKYAKTNNTVAHYIKQDINALGFKSDCFDYILATEVFEHLPDPPAAMRELKRVAKKNAMFIISIPYEPFFHWGNLLRGRHLMNLGKTPNHINFWKKSEFNEFLGKYINIKQKISCATFPWLLYSGIFR